MRRSIAASLVTLAAASALGFAPAASAEESDSVRSTPSYRVWIYEWTNFDGREKSYIGTDREFANDEWDGSDDSVDNMATSVDSNSPRTVTLHSVGNRYPGGPCGGDAITLSPFENISNLGPRSFNNRASCIIFK